MQKIDKKKKKIIAIAAISVAALAFFSLVRSCTKGSGDKFEYSEVTVGKAEKTITVTGILEISDMATILSKTTGVMEKILVDYNQEVSKGQVLAVIDAKDIEQRMSKIVTQIEASKLELAIAKEDIESKRGMFKENLISEKGMERAEMNYKSAQLRYKQILIDYEITRTQKDYTRITAPISGIVMKMNAIKDAPVTINTPLFMIAPNMKKMQLTANVDESDIGLVKKGQSVSFTVSAFQDRNFTGKIEQVRMTPVLRGGLVTYDAIVSCDNPEQILKPGMTATATIMINTKEKAMRVPNQALLVNPIEGRSESDKTIVWRKAARLTGKLPVEKVNVEIGLRGDNFTEIKKNLKKGDQILVKFIKGAKDSKN